MTDRLDKQQLFEEPNYTVSQAAASFNDLLTQTIPSIKIVGEIANFKDSHSQPWIFFDIKDDQSCLHCFAVRYQIRGLFQDGQQVVITARPEIKKWGNLSLIVSRISPIGEGSIKKSFLLLKDKLTKEGLFAVERKKSLPTMPTHIGVISSAQAAGYQDFIKIASSRMSGLSIDVISTNVQGDSAADQIITALSQFNQAIHPPQVIAILRGGGSREDLVTFDDEKLVRAIASSRIPVITGIGHEIDETLADLAADKRASTPSNAAEILITDKQQVSKTVYNKLAYMANRLENQLHKQQLLLQKNQTNLTQRIESLLQERSNRLKNLEKSLLLLDPKAILQRGYAILWQEYNKTRVEQISINDILEIETIDQLIKAEVTNVRNK